MLTLAGLAELHRRHADDLAHPVEPVVLGELVIGGDRPALMGVVNLSPDSYYRESVAFSTKSAIRKARVQAAQGADVVDLGAESSVDGTGRVEPAAQAAALVPVVAAIAGEVAVSVETYHPAVVKACLEAGARVLNMTGREHEDEMLGLAAEHDAAVVMCFGETANVREVGDLPADDDALPRLLDHFAGRIEHARGLGVRQVVVDPGVGFTYGNVLADPGNRLRAQVRILAASFRLRRLGVPVCNALPHAIDLYEEEFRTAEGFFATVATLGGTHLLRTHEVAKLRALLAVMTAVEV